MENGFISKGDMLRLIGVMAICVGIAWACQILAFGSDGTALTRMVWVLGAAAIAGAGAGTVYTASSLNAEEASEAF